MPTLTKQLPTWIPSAPISFNIEQEVTASPDDVWAAVIDYERWVGWFPGAKACRPTDPAHDGVGSTRFVHMDAFKVTEEITVWEPGEAWAMSVIEANLPVLDAMAEQITITPIESGGAHVDWAVGVSMKGWAAPLKPMLVGNTKKALAKALADLDAHVRQH